MLDPVGFIFVAIGVSIVVRAFKGGGSRRHRDVGPPQPPVMLEDRRVAQLQAEVDDLRTQVERLSAAESFYAQLNAPTPPSGTPPQRPPEVGSGGIGPGG
jgi:hypothetical protein